MRKTTLPILLATSLAVATPLFAQTDFNDFISGLAQSLVTQEADRTAYLEAQRQNTVSAYRNYLTKFPKGAYRTSAQQNLAKLGVAVRPVDPLPGEGVAQSAAAREAAIGLSRTSRIRIQKQLTALGYDTGFPDGLWGANTRRALARWQTANKFPANGYITVPQVKMITAQSGPAVGTDNGGATADDPIEERLLGLTYSERREVQRRLTSLGYATGGVDGSFGQNTRRALAQWQRDEGVRVSGYLTADQLRLLRRQTGG